MTMNIYTIIAKSTERRSAYLIILAFNKASILTVRYDNVIRIRMLEDDPLNSKVVDLLKILNKFINVYFVDNC